MHACGHDCHTAIMLGVAKTVVESGLREKIKGNLRLIFQPAEELISGARAMVEAGVLDRPPRDPHSWPATWIWITGWGQVGIARGVSHASSDTFKLTIHGKGGHGARPHQTADPIPAAIHFYNAVQTIMSRNVDARESAVISICQIQAGAAANVIPDQALLRGTVRAHNPQIRQLISQRLTAIAESLPKAFGVTAELVFERGVPCNINEDDATRELVQAAAKVLGEDNIIYVPPRMGSEDFAFFSQRVSGAMLRLGCANPEGGLVHITHSPRFDVDEAVLPMGVEIFIQAVKDYLC